MTPAVTYLSLSLSASRATGLSGYVVLCAVMSWLGFGIGGGVRQAKQIDEIDAHAGANREGRFGRTLTLSTSTSQ